MYMCHVSYGNQGTATCGHCDIHVCYVFMYLLTDKMHPPRGEHPPPPPILPQPSPTLPTNQTISLTT